MHFWLIVCLFVWLVFFLLVCFVWLLSLGCKKGTPRLPHNFFLSFLIHAYCLNISVFIIFIY